MVKLGLRGFGILGLVGWLFSTGCASTDTGDCTDINQSKIYQSLNASYDTESDRTTASATLRFNGSTGTTLSMNGHCSITNSQFTLTKSTLLGTSYSGNGQGFKAAHSFTFTDDAGRTYTNSNTIPTVAFTTTPTSVSKAAGITVTFTPAVSANETVRLVITSTAGTGSAFASTTTVGATTVTAASSEFSTMSLGAATIYLEKTSSVTPSQITEAGGLFTVTYTGTKSTITVGN